MVLFSDRSDIEIKITKKLFRNIYILKKYRWNLNTMSRTLLQKVEISKDEYESIRSASIKDCIIIK